MRLTLNKTMPGEVWKSYLPEHRLRAVKRECKRERRKSLRRWRAEKVEE